jgi:hypothetical protein
MTTEEYNQIYIGFQGLVQNKNLSRQEGRKFMNKIDRIRCGENESLSSNEQSILEEVDKVLHARLGENIQWSPN